MIIPITTARHNVVGGAGKKYRLPGNQLFGSKQIT